MKKYKVIDLFAGIGGIRLGFEMCMPVETVFVSEINKYARKTYYDNFHDNFIIDTDITKVKAEDIPAFDICLAGFPCQAFSKAGKSKGFQDTRGNLFQEVIRICKIHKPKVIFCENVKNLLNHNKKQTFKTIYHEFQKLNYKVYYQVLNSKDYGLAQSRERVYIVCFREEVKFSFPEPYKYSVTLRDILEDAPISSKYYCSEQYIKYLHNKAERNKEKGNGFGYRILDLDGISNTLVCGGMGNETVTINLDKIIQIYTDV